MAKKVYVLTAGAYSDYGIVGIAGDEITAKAWCDLVNKSADKYDDLTEYAEYDVEIGTPRLALLHTYLGAWEKNGKRTTWKQYKEGSYDVQTLDYYYTHGETIVFTKRNLLRVTMPSEANHNYLTVTGEDKAKVEKAFYDRRAMLEAERAGIA